jgi:hypothetical protein
MFETFNAPAVYVLPPLLEPSSLSFFLSHSLFSLPLPLPSLLAPNQLSPFPSLLSPLLLTQVRYVGISSVMALYASGRTKYARKFRRFGICLDFILLWNFSVFLELHYESLDQPWFENFIFFGIHEYFQRNF